MNDIFEVTLSSAVTLILCGCHVTLCELDLVYSYQSAYIVSHESCAEFRIIFHTQQAYTVTVISLELYRAPFLGYQWHSSNR